MCFSTRKLNLIFFLFLCYEVSLAQLSGHGELGLGVQDNSNSVRSIEAGIGYSFCGLYGFCGLKLGVHDIANYPFSSFNQKNPADEYIFNFNLLTGVRYNISLYKNTSSSIEHIGLFPEYRYYYTPILTNQVSYYNNNEELVTVKGGGIQSSFAHGVGLGVFAGELDHGYFYLKGEFNTLNPFKVLNSLSYENPDLSFGLSQQYLITIGYYYRH